MAALPSSCVAPTASRPDEQARICPAADENGGPRDDSLSSMPHICNPDISSMPPATREQFSRTFEQLGSPYLWLCRLCRTVLLECRLYAHLSAMRPPHTTLGANELREYIFPKPQGQTQPSAESVMSGQIEVLRQQEPLQLSSTHHELLGQEYFACRYGSCGASPGTAPLHTNSMVAHLRSDHGVSIPSTRLADGRREALLLDPNINVVRVLVVNGRKNQGSFRFVLRDPTRATAGSGGWTTPPPDLLSAADEGWDRSRRRLDDMAAQVFPSQDNQTVDIWLNSVTRWAPLLTGADLREVAQYTDWTSPRWQAYGLDKQLAVLVRSTISAVNLAEHNLRAADQQVLMWIRTNTNEKPYRLPLAPYNKPATATRSAKAMCRILTFIIIARVVAPTLPPGSWVGPHVALSPEQDRLFQTMMRSATAAVEDGVGDQPPEGRDALGTGDEDDEDDEDDTDDSDSDPDSEDGGDAGGAGDAGAQVADALRRSPPPALAEQTDYSDRTDGRVLNSLFPRRLFFPLRGVEADVVAFILSLLAEGSTADVGTSLARALVVFGVHRGGYFIPPRLISSPLSALLKVARLFLVQDLYEAALRRPDFTEEQDLSKYVQGRLVRQLSVYVLPESKSGIPELLRLRSAAMTLGQQVTAEPHFHYDSSSGVASYKEYSLSLRGPRSLQSMYRQLLSEATHLFGRGVLFTDTVGDHHLMQRFLERCRPDRIRDQGAAASAVVAGDFDPNGSFAKSASSLLNRMVACNSRLRGHLWERRPDVDEPQTGERWRLSPDAIKRYLAAVEDFKEMLLLLMHVSGGGPARLPELLSVRHAALATSAEGRGVGVHAGCAYFLTTYHKSQNLSGRMKPIHRFVPHDVGTLLLRYVFAVVPFAFHLQTIIADAPDGASHGLLASPTPSLERTPSWTGDRFSKALRKCTTRFLGQPVSVSAWRHIAIGIARKCLGPEVAAMQTRHADAADAEAEDDIQDLQAGHTSRTAYAIYARDSADRAGTRANRVALYREASRQWHVGILGIDERPGARGEVGQEPVPGDGVADRNVGPAGEAYGGGEIRLADVREPPATAHDDVARSREDSLTSYPWQQNPREAIARCLPRLFGRGAAWRHGQQHDAAAAVLAADRHTLIVWPTSGGKSSTFMLPALVEGAAFTTVVVQPLVTLIEASVGACLALGVTAARWSSALAELGGRPPTLLFVTPEGATSGDFGVYLGQLRRMSKLRRVVIDECHLAVHERSTFRRAFRELTCLTVYDVPLVFLSGTLPSTVQHSMLRSYGISAQQIKEFRLPTSRRNLSYSCVGVSPQRDPVEAIRDLVNMLNDTTDGKTLVFCRSIAQLERLSGALDIGFYHAFRPERDEASREDEMAAHLQRFRDADPATRPVLATTSALGLGIDLPSVSSVIHDSPPDDMLEYLQQSGRAARGAAEVGTAFVLVPEHWSWREPSPGNSSRLLSYDAARRFVTTRSCRRLPINELLDGHPGRACSEPDGDSLCDRCTRARSYRSGGSGSSAHTVSSSLESAMTATMAQSPPSSPPASSAHDLAQPEQAASRKRARAEDDGADAPEPRAAPPPPRQPMTAAAREAEQTRLIGLVETDFEPLVKAWMRVERQVCLMCYMASLPNPRIVNCGGTAAQCRNFPAQARRYSEARMYFRSRNGGFRLENNTACWTCWAPYGRCRLAPGQFRCLGHPDEAFGKFTIIDITRAVILCFELHRGDDQRYRAYVGDSTALAASSAPATPGLGQHLGARVVRRMSVEGPRNERFSTARLFTYFVLASELCGVEPKPEDRLGRGPGA